MIRSLEERDIQSQPDDVSRQQLLGITEGNCPLYLVRAATLHRYLKDFTNLNAQQQYYLTDLMENISREGGDIRTITTNVADPNRSALLGRDAADGPGAAEGILASRLGAVYPDEVEIRDAASLIATDRPAGQVASIARQLSEIHAAAAAENLSFKPEQPVGIGISGGAFASHSCTRI